MHRTFVGSWVSVADSAAAMQQAGSLTLCRCAVGLVSQPYAENVLEAAKKPLATVEQLSRMTLHELYLKSP